MLYFARFEVGQPAGMPLDQFLAHWYEEAKAAQQAQAAGVVKGLWKVAGQRVVLAVLDLPDHDAVDRALAGLPIFRSLGGAIKTEIVPIRPYEAFAEDLRRAVEGAAAPAS